MFVAEGRVSQAHKGQIQEHNHLIKDEFPFPLPFRYLFLVFDFLHAFFWKLVNVVTFFVSDPHQCQGGDTSSRHQR